MIRAFLFLLAMTCAASAQIINPGTVTKTAPALTLNDCVVGNGGNQIKTASCASIEQYKDVTTFGAVCDGVTDDLVAINAAIAASNAGNLPLIFPSGKACRVSAALTALTCNCDVFGYGWRSSELRTSHATADLLTHNGRGAISNMMFTTAVGTPKTAGYHIVMGGNGLSVSNIWSQRAYVGIYNTGRINFVSTSNIELMTSRNVAANSGGILNEGGILHVTETTISGATAVNNDMPEYGFKGIGGAVGGEYDIAGSTVLQTNVCVQVQSTAAFNWNGLKFHGSWCDNNLAHGILVDSSAGASNGPTDIAEAWIAPGAGGAAITAGIEFRGATTGDATVVGSTIYSYNNLSGVGIYSNTGSTINLTLSGNKIGGAGTGFVNGVQLSNNTANVSITGGVIKGNTTGITIGSGNSHITIGGIVLQGNTGTIANFTGASGTIKIGLSPPYDTISAGGPIGSSTTVPVITWDGDGRLTAVTSAATGDLVGPASSTDNAAVRFDGATGKLSQNSALIIADTTAALSRNGGGGIPVQGTNTNNSATAGDVGELIETTVASGSAVTIATNSLGSATSMGSVILTAGDWDISVVFNFVTGGGTAQNFIGCLSTTANARGGEETYMTNLNGAGSGTFTLVIASFRVTTTGATYHANGSASWTGGSSTAVWGRISARRRR